MDANSIGAGFTQRVHEEVVGERERERVCEENKGPQTFCFKELHEITKSEVSVLGPATPFEVTHSVSSSFFAVSHNEGECHLHDRIDQYYDDRHTVPFSIEEETFPVPVSLPEEKWVPGKPLRISYVSWNMAHRRPNFEDVSGHCIHPNAHIVAVCTQENGSYVRVKKEQRQWERHVRQNCLHGEYVLVGRKELWYIQLLVYARKKDVASYVGYSEASSVKTGIANGLGGNKGGVAVALSIGMTVSPLQMVPGRRKGENTSHTEGSTSSVFSPREGGPCSVHVGEGVNFEASAPPRITLLFVGAHLSAHQKGVHMRNKDYLSIVRSLRVGSQGRHKALFRERVLHECPFNEELKDVDGGDNNEVLVSGCGNGVGDECGDVECSSDLSLMRLPVAQSNFDSRLYRDVTDEFDLVFFGGDLNYRINGTRKAIEYIIKNHKDVRSILVHNDQLNLERAKGLVFRRFYEGNLLFRPTYKYEIAHDAYNYTKKKDRMPAYCDRVLYKRGQGSRAGRVRIRLYTDVQHLRTSDHRPVVAIFDLATCAHLPSFPR
ncbi:putative endonuclease/exonuclease/phosphatase [Trypanosoma cruzi]|uniref:Endonuclease/exonuclease/phosphatase n=1 Tax=Trypanosoma cruzi Dm28c TaxID=1416333 RepID=V5BUZ4_TRYCR|nr:endonuclease/exonuclease/phosphatase [Trypanosoma cruzi Dm28c]PBJ71989.1 endonuclease/exonuclease/phosphatase [Trypanosoma cruzi cruzi]RNF23913.1 putative endonuclease/exonuclease/phosphatase [Trypanosoma cruzi]